MQAWLLCVFVAPHISLVVVVNLGSMRWALLLFKYFRSMSGLSHSCCRWPESKTIVRSKRSLDFVRSRFTRVRPLEHELLSAIRHLSIFNIIHIRLNFFCEATDFLRAFVFNHFLYRESAINRSNTLYQRPHPKLDQPKVIQLCAWKICSRPLQKWFTAYLSSVPSEKYTLSKGLF